MLFDGEEYLAETKKISLPRRGEGEEGGEGRDIALHLGWNEGSGGMGYKIG